MTKTASARFTAAARLPACTPTINGAADIRFGLVKGGIYQISFFQAERHTSASNFRLSLQNFLPAHSQCVPNCGDGKVVIGEVCDDGSAENTGAYGHCNATCSAREFCGDGLMNGPEKCDNGVNLAGYNASSGCAPGCVLPPKCGDATVDFTFKEECDDGTAKNTGAYGGCTSTCKAGPFCGDQTINSPQETCDDGSANGGYGKACGYDCQPGARCGDGIKNGTEQCDLGDGKNVGGYGGCKANCTFDARCGDNKLQAGEDCDDGKNLGGYGKCAPGCKYGARCGDGIKNGTEQCDDGVNDGSYGKCGSDCKFGARCGDKVVQSPETCDAGISERQGRLLFELHRASHQVAVRRFRGGGAEAARKRDATKAASRPENRVRIRTRFTARAGSAGAAIEPVRSSNSNSICSSHTPRAEHGALRGA